MIKRKYKECFVFSSAREIIIYWSWNNKTVYSETKFWIINMRCRGILKNSFETDAKFTNRSLCLVGVCNRCYCINIP